ncbi:hypothetical protein UVI_02026140 [Ustilaginoidea virens]|uniref:Uncharacterized protein n=1 Tax=Ustilaginoidea virens TaxID=1159556 RepID=A0A1B5KTI0_USTVR|nr:hypothetical protein UVI_02026140 [Ustilaginoidea virens]
MADASASIKKKGPESNDLEQYVSSLISSLSAKETNVQQMAGPAVKLCSLFLVANFELARQAVPNGAKVLRTVHSRHAGGDRRVILTQGQIRGRQAGSREADRPPAEYAKYLCLFVSLGLMIDRSREGTARYRLRACCADGHVLRATMTHIRIESNRIEQSSGSGVVLVLTSVVRGPASVGWDEAENIHPFSVPAIMTIMIAETNRSS